MNALRLLIALVMGRAHVVRDIERVEQWDTERLSVELVFNRERGDGRVITNTSTRVARVLHSDLVRVPEPQVPTERYAMALGQALHGEQGGKA
ncbi:hypothetical protein [Deinococcus wulumuqiensis]|uniref:hypothetical protein n=1 Tax=Deinococcus wulumuqiensis TaxID=980427 RepID=UPI00242F9CAD|nr:hypothetical protein [Deinococcus wulumuqiensis]